MPFISKEILRRFEIERLERGKLYHTAGSSDLTVIRTGMGAGLVGDAVLYLKDTPCRNVILFGSCGAARESKDFSIGTLVAPAQCYGAESFTDFLLQGKTGEKAFEADKELLRDFLTINRDAGIRQVNCLTVASLKLEEERLDSFIAQGIEVIDMECSAFFSAASFAGLKVMAVFYVSDIIKNKPFYVDLDPDEKSKLSSIAEAPRNSYANLSKNNQKPKAGGVARKIAISPFWRK